MPRAESWLNCRCDVSRILISQREHCDELRGIGVIAYTDRIVTMWSQVQASSLLIRCSIYLDNFGQLCCLRVSIQPNALRCRRRRCDSKTQKPERVPSTSLWHHYSLSKGISASKQSMYSNDVEPGSGVHEVPLAFIAELRGLSRGPSARSMENPCHMHHESNISLLINARDMVLVCVGSSDLCPHHPSCAVAS